MFERIKIGDNIKVIKGKEETNGVVISKNDNNFTNKTQFYNVNFSKNEMIEIKIMRGC